MSKLDISHYMQSRYVNGGREWPEYDCWGMTRHAYQAINGHELPRFDGLDAASGFGKSREYKRLAISMPECEPRHGAIASVVRGKVCEHVGVCVEIAGAIYVLETTEPTGPRVITYKQFVKDHDYVKCHAHS